MKHDNMRPFNNTMLNGRNHAGYGNTKIKPERYGAPFYPGIFADALIVLFVGFVLVVGAMAVMP